MAAFSEFLAYKTRVPVRGAILLNEEMDSVVLVKGWKKGANWSFPRGKINKGEPDLDCAIREVYEETGFDVRAANLVKAEDSVKSIEVTMREQHMRLFVFPDVPRDTHFEPRTRKEISKIEWYKLSELPTLKKNKQHDEGMAVANANKFYMVAPFLHPLKKWIAQQKKLAAKDQTGLKPSLQAEGYTSVDENGYRGDFAAYGGGVSDLPEVDAVVPVPDASSHIKQLLKIGEGHAEPIQTQASSPAQPPAVDQMKSNALLALLRTGSQGPVSQAQKKLPLFNTLSPQAYLLPLSNLTWRRISSLVSLSNSSTWHHPISCNRPLRNTYLGRNRAVPCLLCTLSSTSNYLSLDRLSLQDLQRCPNSPKCRNRAIRAITLNLHLPILHFREMLLLHSKGPVTLNSPSRPSPLRSPVPLYRQLISCLHPSLLATRSRSSVSSRTGARRLRLLMPPQYPFLRLSLHQYLHQVLVKNARLLFTMTVS